MAIRWIPGHRAACHRSGEDGHRAAGQLRDSERILSDTQDRRNEADATLQRLQAQIRKLPSANKGLATQAALFDALREIFDSAVEEFRQRLRVDVEREASEIHKALSAEPGYGGLKINEQFGLSLVNDRGRVITDRSAGSEQIVALSLIGALNRCATREGPIVMDTPFGRLDRRHRHNILKFAPNFGAQVVLLVQSGELERDRDLADLAPHVAREYRVERDGASDRSRIRVKDSVNLILWFAKDASKTKADNRRVLKRYSASMDALLKNGYQIRKRPSNHNITGKFMVDNKGAIPPNLLGFADGDQSDLQGEPFDALFDNILAVSNTISNDNYLAECRLHGVKPHNARFPKGLPAFFIEFLTERNDVVYDPFAGSNTTGEVAEALGRKWVSCELDAEGKFAGTYVRSSAFRFDSPRFEPGFEVLPDEKWVSQAKRVRPASVKV